MKRIFKRIIDFLNKNIKNNFLKHHIAGFPITLITFLVISFLTTTNAGASLSIFAGLGAGALWEHYFKSKNNDQIKDILATGSSSLYWVLLEIYML